MMPRTTQAERIAALEGALVGAAKDIADLTALVRTLVTPIVSAPVNNAQASSPADPEAGMGYKARRAYALAHKVAGRYCDGKGQHAAHGFAFAKTCDR